MPDEVAPSAELTSRQGMREVQPQLVHHLDTTKAPDAIVAGSGRGREDLRMANATSSVSDPAELSGYAVRSYRYLRMAIVVVLLALICSVALERAHASCWEVSISAYYYTPVHSLFVGALVALGVCLVAIRGSTDVEDVLLNVAGVLAPIVAFVPTAQPGNLCTKHPLAADKTLAYIDNNLVALGIALVLALVIAIATVFRTDNARRPKIGGNAHAVLGVVLSGALLAGGIVWYFVSRSSFLDHAHSGSAGVLFLLVGVVVFINGLSSPHRSCRRGYLIVAMAIVLTFVLLLVVGLLDPDWHHQILWLELLELSLLIVFWTMQTAELWEPGVPTGSARATRTRLARSSRPGQAVTRIAEVGRPHRTSSYDRGGQGPSSPRGHTPR